MENKEDEKVLEGTNLPHQKDLTVLLEAYQKCHSGNIIPVSKRIVTCDQRKKKAHTPKRKRKITKMMPKSWDDSWNRMHADKNQNHSNRPEEVHKWDVRHPNKKNKKLGYWHLPLGVIGS